MYNYQCVRIIDKHHGVSVGESIHRKTLMRVAIKRIRKTENKWYHNEIHVLRELESMDRIPNVIGYEETIRSINIIMEMVDGVRLDYITSTQPSLHIRNISWIWLQNMVTWK